VYFEQDNQRGTLKPVYQITGTSPNYSFIQLPNPMTLSSIGTFVDALDNPVIPYFFPYDANGDAELYFVRCTSSTDVPQFTREAVPYIPASSESAITSIIENELSNPQFAEVLFESPLTITFNAVTDEVISIAPNWDLVLTSPGVGSVTMNVLTPTGSLNRITNPGTLLNITSAGLSSLKLRQRIYGSPNLWGSGYIAGTFVAKTYGGTDATLTLSYSQSDGTVVDEVIITATLTADGAYAAHTGTVLIPASNSTESFPDAYIDIFFDLPLSTEIDITSVMIAFTNETSIENISYSQESLDRQVDHLFHYYKPQLEYKPIPSYLVGWDFPLNPAQPHGSTIAAPFATGANTSNYVWDQTIAFQSVDSSLTFSRSSTTKGLSITAAVATQFAIIQYLPLEQARELLSSRNAIALKGSISTGTLTGYINLYWTTDASLPDLNAATYHSLVSGLTAGVPAVANGTWTKVTRGNLNEDASFSLTTTNTEFTFNGWDATSTAGKTTATYLAIVISFDQLSLASVATLDYCSLVCGDIATRPAPQTPDEVLRECQYYYESTYPIGSAPGAVEITNLVLAQQDIRTTGGNDLLLATPFGYRYQVNKRTAPALTFYSGASGTAGKVEGYLYQSGASVNQTEITFSTGWTVLTNGTKGFIYVPPGSIQTFTSAGAGTLPQAFIGFHNTADARLGIV
jgi:hypothetical protein